MTGWVDTTRPVLLFSVGLGVSTDCEVFLLSRMLGAGNAVVMLARDMTTLRSRRVLRLTWRANW